MFIFQFAAMIFLRISKRRTVGAMIIGVTAEWLPAESSLHYSGAPSLLFSQSRDPRQFFTFNQLKGSASAGGDEGHFVGQTGLLARGHGIAPADDGGSARFGKRLGNRFR